MSRKLTRVAILGVLLCSVVAFGMPVARVHAAPLRAGVGQALPPTAVVYRGTISHTLDPAFLKAHPEFMPHPMSSVGIGPDLIQPPPGAGGTWVCTSELVAWRGNVNPTTFAAGLGSEMCNVGMTSQVIITGIPCVPVLWGCLWGGVTGTDEQTVWQAPGPSFLVVNPPDTTVYFPPTGNLTWTRSPQFFLASGSGWLYEMDLNIVPHWPDGTTHWTGTLPFCRINNTDTCAGP